MKPLLPLNYESPSQAEIIFHVEALDTVYTATASSCATKNYLQELQAISKLIGKTFEEVLNEELTKLSEPPISPRHDKTLNLDTDTGPKLVDLTTAQPHDHRSTVHSAPFCRPHKAFEFSSIGS